MESVKMYANVTAAQDGNEILQFHHLFNPLE